MSRTRLKFIDDTTCRYKSLDEAMQDFLKLKIAQGMADLTLKDYKNTFKRYLKTSKNIMNIDIMKSELLEFMTALSDASPAKVNRPYSNLCALFNWLVSQNALEHNPLKLLGLKKKKDEGKIRSIEAEQLKKLLDVIDLKTYVGLRDYTIILLMMDCGIRPCEAFKIELKDINFSSGFLTVRRENSKTRNERTLPLSQIILDLLGKIVKVKSKLWKNDLVFCSYDGLPMHIIMFDKRLAYYSEKAGVKIRPYDLRHTFAIMYLRNNGNTFTLQKTMGHSDLSMTKRYLGITVADLKEQHQKASPLHNVIQRNTRVNKLFK